MTSRCYPHIDELGRSHCCFRHQAPAGQQNSTGSEAIDLRSGLDKTRRRQPDACGSSQRQGIAHMRIYGFRSGRSGRMAGPAFV